jgi:hypothetical protein
MIENYAVGLVRLNQEVLSPMKQPTTSHSPMSHLPQVSGDISIDSATLELLATWRVQDATTDPEQIQAAVQELADFKRAMNENRIVGGEPPLFP